MNVPFLDLNLLNSEFLPEIRSEFDNIFEKSNYILGEQVANFETKYAEYCGVEHCVGVSSGTEALHLALRALDIGPGDEVITVANTFVATVLAISYVGATPVLVDCDPDTYNIDVTQIKNRITTKTKAIIPVHLYGQSCDMDPIISIAKEYGIYVVEDASQAHGAMYKGRIVGSIGDIGCFSFYPGKNLGAFGDAGCLVTRDAILSNRLKMLRNYGSPKKYYHDFIGYNARLDTLQAVVLQSKLKKLDEFNKMRLEAAKIYSEMLGCCNNVVLPKYKSDGSHVFHLYVVQVDRREEVINHLNKVGVQTAIHYPNSIYTLGAYKELVYNKDSLNVTDRISSRILSLPIYPGITVEQVNYVCRHLMEVA